MSIEYMYEINKIAETDTQLEITRKDILMFIQFIISMFLVMLKNLFIKTNFDTRYNIALESIFF